jgi:hypothetical protein
VPDCGTHALAHAWVKGVTAMSASALSELFAGVAQSTWNLK